MHVLSYLFFMFAGYLSGSILYSYLIPRWFCHLDITKLSDDGNPGAANAVKCAKLESGACLRGFGYLKGFFSGLYRYASSRFYQLVVYPCDFRAGIRPCLFPLLERKGRKSYRCFLWRAAGASSLVPCGVRFGYPLYFPFYRRCHQST